MEKIGAQKRIAIINGPNLNLTGKREPEVYGTLTFEDYIADLRQRYPQVEIDYFQSNSEGALIDKIHEEGYNPATIGIIINPGAYAHYSIAIADAIRAIPAPVVEVHISNIHAREDFRHKSVISNACRAVAAGFGMKGYELALLSFVS
jgi:3-dehydroquinate dehydratase-2